MNVKPKFQPLLAFQAKEEIICEAGDWILVDENHNTIIMPGEMFHTFYEVSDEWRSYTKQNTKKKRTRFLGIKSLQSRLILAFGPTVDGTFREKMSRIELEKILSEPKERLTPRLGELSSKGILVQEKISRRLTKYSLTDDGIALNKKIREELESKA